MHPHDTTTKLRTPRCPTCQKIMHLDGTCTNCAKPEVAEYYRLQAQGLRCCNICKEVRALADFALIRKGQERRCTICRDCSDAKNKAYRDANAARLKARQDARKQERHENYKRWYADPENRRKLRAHSTQWKKRNPDKEREWRRKWSRANPDKVRVQAALSRARRANLPATLTIEDWGRAVAHWQGRCAYCDKQEGLLKRTRLTSEHFVPLSLPDSPGSTPDNIIPVCHSCNERRRRQDVRKWLTKTFGTAHADRMLAKIAAYFDWVRDLQLL